MRRRHPLVASCVAISLTLTGTLSPALAGGLIPTEQVVTQSAPTPARLPTSAVAAERAELMTALVAGGVEPGQARARVAALTDAEIDQLARNLDSAPAGGLWFIPFLMVAAMIGALIGIREPGAGGAATDLFGRPRSVAVTP